MDWIHVYIGLGSNLQHPTQQVHAAYAAMNFIPQTQPLRLSPLYRSAPVGPEDQPDFINAAAHLITQLPPLSLLRALQSIEQQQQRVRKQRWGPRTIDLDLLLYGAVSIATAQMDVPHLHLRYRNFVLAPLLDLAPDLRLPDGTLVAEHLARVGDSGLTPITLSSDERSQ